MELSFKMREYLQYLIKQPYDSERRAHANIILIPKENGLYIVPYEGKISEKNYNKLILLIKIFLENSEKEEDWEKIKIFGDELCINY